MLTRPTVLLTIILIVIGFSVSQAGSYPERHNGLYLGVGGGFGRVKIMNDHNVSYFNVNKNIRGGLTSTFRAGIAAGNQILFGLEIDSWYLKSGDAASQYNNYAFCITGYPDDRFYITAGLSICRALDNYSNNPDDKSGSGIIIGAGIEERIFKHVAVLPRLHYIYQSYKSYSVSNLSLNINICWFQ